MVNSRSRQGEEEMTDKQPTKEQWEELAMLCGFVFYVASGNWRAPDGRRFRELPEPDLNFLFAYAVPKAIDVIMRQQGCSSDIAYAILFNKWLRKLELDIPNHAGTLFWTI